MKIGILSDIHELSWIFKLQNQTKRETALEYLIKDIILKDAEEMDLLIIAGDIGESPSRIINFLRAMKKYSNIEKILFSAGNHEHYSSFKINKLYDYPIRYSSNPEKPLEDPQSMIRDRELEEIFYIYENDGIKKVNLLIDYINENIDGVIATNNGETLDIDGIKIAGTSGWYDGKSFYEKHKNSFGTMPFESNFIQRKIEKVYEKNLDRKYASEKPFDNWNNYYKEIIENMETDLDIIITHPIPMIETMAFDEEYKFSDQNAFFSFDGIEMIKEKRPKYWIHGHSHNKRIWDVYDTTVIRAPLGHMTEWDERGRINNLTYINIIGE